MGDVPCAARDSIPELASLLALVYHEARNVRYLVKGGYLDRSGCGKLLVLPNKRVEAWKAVQNTRRRALSTNTADQACRVFGHQFGIGLDQLVTLYENPDWKHAKLHGGNAWASITRMVIGLAKAIDQSDQVSVEMHLSDLKKASHNKGTLMTKLMELDRSLEG